MSPQGFNIFVNYYIAPKNVFQAKNTCILVEPTFQGPVCSFIGMHGA